MSEAALDNQYADELRRSRAGGSDSPFNKGGGGDLDAGDGGTSFRERVTAARRAKDEEEERGDEIEDGRKSAGLFGLTESKLKDKLLNFIPGYGPWAAFKKAVTGRGKKLDLISIIIMLFSNIEALFIILGALALIIIIVSFMGGAGWESAKMVWELVKGLGWTAVTAIKNLF